MARVAVLGAGRMGSAMATRLATEGHSVVIWNRTRSRAEAVATQAQNVTVGDQPTDTVRECDVVLSMLADGAATCEVLLSSEVLSALRSGSLVVDLGTSGPDAARRLAAELSRHGVGFVDAPVSGSIPAVESGTLLIMAGGAPEHLERADVVFGSLARKVVRVGEPGAGQIMKLAVNLVLHDLNAAMAEALQLAEAAHVAREDAYTVLQESVVGAPYVQYKRPAFLDTETPVAMTLALVEKDLGLVTAQARAVGRPAPVTEAVLRAVHRAVASGLGSRDMADLSRFIEDSEHESEG